MNTAQTWQTTCTNLDETSRLAEALGRSLRGGETVELLSDLGGGKTTFVRGLAKGAGSHDLVSSPSFTLMNQYETGGLTICHFDFYRLHEAGIMREELAEVIGDEHTVVVVEWADVVHDVLPAERLTIRIASTGETERQFELKYPAKLEYLLPAST
jgi:tRNA threonylcarbamoyladenosine biosynthesis protein TsaE